MAIASFFRTLFRMGPTEEDRAFQYTKPKWELPLSPEEEAQLAAYEEQDALIAVLYRERGICKPNPAHEYLLRPRP